MMKGQKEEPYENLTTGVLYAVNLHTVIQEVFFFYGNNSAWWDVKAGTLSSRTDHC